MAIVELNSVVKKFKKFTLDNVSFELDEGKIYGFVGENGSGKSTTMKAMNGLLFLNSGSIRIFGKDINNLTTDDKEQIGVVLDEICLPPKMNVKEINKIFKNIFLSWDEVHFFNLVKQFGLDEKLKIEKYSKGMKAKLNLIIAFSHHSRLLILDEPLNGLDPVARDEISDMLIQFAKNNGTVLISSHILTDLEKLCNEIIFIHQGKIILQEDIKSLIGRYDKVTLSLADYNNIDKENVIKVKDNGTNEVSLLVKKGSFSGTNVEPATLDDIIVFFIRGKNA